MSMDAMTVSICISGGGETRSRDNGDTPASAEEDDQEEDNEDDGVVHHQRAEVICHSTRHSQTQGSR